MCRQQSLIISGFCTRIGTQLLLLIVLQTLNAVVFDVLIMLSMKGDSYPAHAMTAPNRSKKAVTTLQHMLL